MRRIVIILLALSMVLVGCGLPEEEAEALDDFLQGLEDLSQSQNGGQGSTGSDSSGSDSSGSDSSGSDSSDSGSDAPPPHTDSPNRPPTLGDNPPVESYYSPGAGVSVEKYEYSPLDASLDDVADHYDDYFDSSAEREEGTRSDGVDYVRWNDGETFVAAYDQGTFVDVEVHYSD